MGFKQTYRILILICIALSIGFLIFHFTGGDSSEKFKEDYQVCFKINKQVSAKKDTTIKVCIQSHKPKCNSFLFFYEQCTKTSGSKNDTICEFLLDLYMSFDNTTKTKDENVIMLSLNSVKKDSIMNNMRISDLKWLTQKRLSNYESNIKSLHNTLLNIVIITLLGVLLIFYRPKGINVSFLSIHIPETLLYLVVIFGSLYLWSNLGLLLNAAIDSRLALDSQFEIITLNFEDLNYQNQMSHILVDNSIVDNWSGHFFEVFESDSESLKVLSSIGLFGIFGLFTALFFAVINVTAIELGYRKGKLEGLSFFLVLLSMSLIITSCIAWVFKHNYSAYYISFIWLLAAIFTFLWKRFRTVTVKNLSSE